MTHWREKIELTAAIRANNDRYDLSRHEKPMPIDAAEAVAREVEKSVTLKRFGKKLRAAKSIAEVNRILECIYNEADDRLVWCGM